MLYLCVSFTVGHVFELSVLGVPTGSISQVHGHYIKILQSDYIRCSLSSCCVLCIQVRLGSISLEEDGRQAMRLVWTPTELLNSFSLFLYVNACVLLYSALAVLSCSAHTQL